MNYSSAYAPKGAGHSRVKFGWEYKRPLTRRAPADEIAGCAPPSPLGEGRTIILLALSLGVCGPTDSFDEKSIGFSAGLCC